MQVFPRRIFASILVLIGTLFMSQSALAETGKAELLAAVRSGDAVAMMRHALAPGTGDPSNFDVDDCSTQRNLSAEGRSQAIQIGKVFRENNIPDPEVLTSAWCRCKETAELLGLGEVEVFSALNSFFQRRKRADVQTRELMEYLKTRTGTKPLVLVTHQVNITALTGVFPNSGETIVFRLDDNDNMEVLGRF